MDPKLKEQTNRISQQPVAAVGTANKEGGIVASTEVPVQSSEALVKVEEELKSIIKVEDHEVPNEPDVGIMASAESTPVVTQPTGLISLPMTEEEVNAELKQSKNKFHIEEQLGDKAGIYVEDSKPFLATLLRKFFQSLKFLKRKMR